MKYIKPLKMLAAAAATAGLVACTDSNNILPTPPTHQSASGTRYQTQPSPQSTQKSYLCEVTLAEKQTLAERPRLTEIAIEPVLPEFTNDKIRKPRSSKDLENTLDENGHLIVYYRKNSDRLYKNDMRDIQGYLRSLKKGTHLIIEGYADQEGTIEDNDVLSRKRAQGVATTIVEKIKSKNFTYTITAFGESQAKGTTTKTEQRDRKVRIVPGKNVIEWGMEQLPSDIYLLDQSGSMNESLGNGSQMTKWKAVLKYFSSYSLPENTRIFTFSTTPGPCNGPIENIKVGGGTPLYDSLSELVSKTENGKSITVLTDGLDNKKGTVDGTNLVNKIIKTARAKDISIKTLALGDGEGAKATLNRIQKETKGSKYFK